MSPAFALRTFGGLTVLREGRPVEGAGAQRRRLALLALLAAAGERGLPREKLVTYLWAESDLERARKNLAQAIYSLRRDLAAEDLILGTTDLRLNPEVVTSDLAEFRRALAEGRLEDAVALYAGPFLDGIFLDEAPEFERWAETERGNLAHEYARVLEAVAGAATARGDTRAAVGFWRRLANADPLSAKVALGLMAALVAAGDRGAALQHYRVYETLLRQELDLAPDSAVRAYADEVRRRSGAAEGERAVSQPQRPAGDRELIEAPVSTLPGTPAVARPAATSAPPQRRIVSGFTDEYARPRPLMRPELPVPAAEPGRLRVPFLARKSTRYGMGIGFVLGLLVVAGVLTMGRVLAPRSGALAGPVVAVGRIQDYTRGGEGLARPLADMLATDLARAPGRQVISTARMYELMAQAGGTADSAAAMIKAARAAGASELLDGALYHRPEGQYRLDLRRTSLATGSVLETLSAEGGDLFALVEGVRQAMVGVADSGTRGSFAQVTTASVLAYRLYEEGLRALFNGDAVGARRLLNQALTEDSTFAMAAYWLARAGGAYNDRSLIDGLNRAVRLAARATDRERLTIMAGWTAATDHPGRMAVAETLTVRYPNEPDGHLWLGDARLWAGDFRGAIAPFRRVIEMDSLSLRTDPRAPGSPPRCRACEAYAQLLGAYDMMDSLPAAERTAREWTTRQPGNPSAWAQLAWTLALRERFQEARAAYQTAIAVGPEMPREGFRALLSVRAGDFEQALPYYEELARGPDPGEGFKWLSILARARGRPREALRPAERLRATERVSRRDAAPYNALFEAAVWFDLGEFRRAAALFDSITRAPRDSTPSQVARHRAWTQTLRATALAAAGDTEPLPAIADSVEAWGRLTSYGRDARLHHHVRGLLLVARGRLEEAADQLRQAIFSPTAGYTRTNLELGRVLLRLDRSREAAQWAEAGMRGPLDASNSYVTQTELAELAARAWDAAGVRDSAAMRYRLVVRNWSNAEPAFTSRVERANLRLAVLAPR